MEILKSGMEKILVIQTAFIGDAVLTLPMIQKLKEFFPVSLIDVVATPVSADLFESSPFVNHVYSYDKRGKDKSVLSLIKFGYEINKKQYTRIYSPHRSVRSSFIVLLSGVKSTYGFSNSSFRFVYKNLVKYESADHEIKRNLTLIGYDKDWHIYPLITAKGQIISKIQSIFSKFSANENFAAVAPGSVWETKKYPKEKYVELISYLLDNSFKVLLVGGALDRNLCNEIAGNFPENVFSYAGDLSVVESIELLKGCKILISNDSAPTHFGMCADIPVLTIYCSTIPEFGFYPYNEKSCHLGLNDLKCKPCGIHGLKKCPEKTFACANLLDIKEIKKKISEIIRNESKVKIV